MNASGMYILALCDSPTLTSGFACVANNILQRWVAAGAKVDVWGIGYEGLPHDLPFRIWPGDGGGVWANQRNLNQRFLTRLLSSPYTHVWVMQDSFMLSRNEFPTQFRKACLNIHRQGQTVARERKVRSAYYFPVDAMEMAPEWCEFMTAVDQPVAYTEQGKRAAETAARLNGWKLDCAIVPHGVDTSVFHPLPLAQRIEARAQMHYSGEQGKFFLKGSDFVVLNVNQHQRRKDIPRTVEVFAEFKRHVPEAKLVLHCARKSNDGVDIEAVAGQFGLRWFEDYVHHGELFDQGMGLMPVPHLATLYNIADCYLTTTLGEGWGLGITEALACGLPCVVPNHTSCAEIASVADELGSDRIRVAGHELYRVVLPQDNSRARYRTEVQSAVARLREVYELKLHQTRPEMPAALQGWLDWDRVAALMLNALRGGEANPPELKIVPPPLAGLEA